MFSIGTKIDDLEVLLSLNSYNFRRLFCHHHNSLYYNKGDNERKNDLQKKFCVTVIQVTTSASLSAPFILQCFRFLPLGAHVLPYSETDIHQGLHAERTPGQRHSVLVQKPLHTT